MSCVGHTGSYDPLLLWPLYRPTAAAPFQPLAWELAYAVDAALKSKKKRGRREDQDIMKSEREVVKDYP